MELEFTGAVWFWKGPAPWYFVTVPPELTDQLEAAAAVVSYGWGMVPVTARLGDTEWTTSLFPKDGGFLVPVRAGVRRAENVSGGDTVTLRLAITV